MKRVQILSTSTMGTAVALDAHHYLVTLDTGRQIVLDRSEFDVIGAA